VPERTGVLVIRIWAESDQSPSLRARITRTLDLTQRDEVSTRASSAEEIEAVVHTWLGEFARGVQTDA
jgi:hypothetical protein